MSRMNKIMIILLVSTVILVTWSCESDLNPPDNPTVFTEDVTNVSNTSAILEITVNGSTSNSDIKGVLYSSTSRIPDTNNGQKIETSYGSSVTFTNLTNGTTYYYRAYITNGTDYIYGDIKAFTTIATLANVKTYAPAGTIVTKTTFNVSAELINSYLVSEWGIVVGFSNTSNLTSGRYDKFPSVRDGKQTMYYTGCDANTRYYYCAYAKLKTGNYIYGEIWSISTAAY